MRLILPDVIFSLLSVSVQNQPLHSSIEFGLYPAPVSLPQLINIIFPEPFVKITPSVLPLVISVTQTQ